MSRVVKVKLSPSFRVIFPSLKVLMRYSGPLVSSMIAIGRSISSRTFLIMLIFAWCSSWEPWEKLSRATFSPARHMALKTSGSELEGPIVQIIFVFRMISLPGRRIKLPGNSNPPCAGGTGSSAFPKINEIHFVIKDYTMETRIQPIQVKAACSAGSIQVSGNRLF